MSLYSLYRPQNFENVVGQEHIIKTIQNQIKNNKVSHAYLFSGPRGIGKTTTARLIAKTINCSNKKNNSEPCDKCGQCLSFNEERNIDIIEIDAASNTGVDNVRENIIENAHFKPTNSPFKVFIIDEAHMLSTNAFNALLKTLEEPPSHTVFILATTELHKLPQTIISRCQRFNFQKIPKENIVEHLKHIAKKEKIEIDNEILEKIAQKSEGHLRDAISLLEQLSSGGKKVTAETAEIFLPNSKIEYVLEFLNELSKKNTSGSVEKLNVALNSNISAKQFAEEILDVLRKILLVKANYKEEALQDTNEGQTKILENIACRIKSKDLVDLVELVFKRKQEIQISPIPQLPLEMIVVEWCGFDEKEETMTPEIKQTEEKSINVIKIETPPPSSIETSIATEQPEKTILENRNLDKEGIMTKWQIFSSKLEEKFPSMAFILRQTGVSDFKSNILYLTVPFSFHKEKLEETKTKSNLLQVFKEIYGLRPDLVVNIQEQTEESPSIIEDLGDIASLVGGEVV